ncbi:MAG: hypothetical protein WKF37_23570 [Bryobacteraceae bacterium]
MQRPEGYWWADLTADTTLESDWILLQLWLHPRKMAFGIRPRVPPSTRRFAQSSGVNYRKAVLIFTPKVQPMSVQPSRRILR